MTIPSIYISPAVLIALALGIVIGYKFQPQIKALLDKIKKGIAGAVVPKS